MTAVVANSWLASDASHLRYPGTAVAAGVGAPVRHQDHARLDRLQAVEVAGELVHAAGPVRDRARCLVYPQRLLERLARVDAVVYGQVAAGGQAVEQPGHDGARLVVVGDVA